MAASPTAAPPSPSATELPGLDIDIAAEVANRLGVTSRIESTEWDALLSSVMYGTCDLVISSMTSTFGNRKDQADLVDYLTPP